MHFHWQMCIRDRTGDMAVYAVYAPIAGQVRLTVNYVYSNGSLAAQPWVSHVAVSYTHLDVYKRQERFRENIRGFGGRNLWKRY